MKHLINIENYEHYALDFIEGNLDEAQRLAFEAFLSQHPQIGEALSGLNKASLTPGIAPVFDASRLKIDIRPTATITATNYEDAFIAEAEGVLDASRAEELDAFTSQNPVLTRDRALYQHTHLRPYPSVRYPLNDLKQPVPLWEYTRTTAFRVAASLALLIGIGALVFPSMNEPAYQYRSANPSFAAIDALPEFSATTLHSAQAAMETDAVTLPPENHSRDVAAALEPMKRRAVAFETQPPELQTHRHLTHDPGIKPWVEVSPSGHTQELTIVQLLGREVLGVEAVDSPRTMLREGVKKAADNTGIAGMVQASKDDGKHTFQLLAGAFEFRRVSYKN